MLDVRELLGQHMWYAAVEKAAVVVAEFRHPLCHSSPYVRYCWLSSNLGWEWWISKDATDRSDGNHSHGKAVRPKVWTQREPQGLLYTPKL